MIERDPRLEARHASVFHSEAQVENRPQLPQTSEHIEPVETGASKASGHRFAWILSLSVVGGLVGLLVVVMIKFVNGPVVASAMTLEKVQATTSPKPTTNQLAGLYFDMTYPAIFDQVGQLKNDNQALEQYNISSKKDYRRVMAVSVRKLPSNQIEDDSSYKYRHVNPKDYTERTDKLGGESVIIMSKIDKSEVTLFWVHQMRILSVSMTSSNPDDVLADFMRAVEPTLRWRQ